MSFQSLGLTAELLRAIEAQGYENPTPVQKATIPPILENRDLMASAQTGTGKTAAFTLPLLHNLMESSGGKGRGVRALILTPTRELAGQVADSVRTYGKNLPLRCTQVYGGTRMDSQIRALRRGVDVLVATPGRLIDHMQRGTVDLSTVDTLILDEADRMLDMGFMPAIERVLKAIPAERQTLLFSATFNRNIKKLAQKLLNNPQVIEVEATNSAASKIEQSAYMVDQGRKRDALSHLIGSKNWQQVLVFTRTKRGADRLAKQLEKDGIPSAAIHGDKRQSQRNRALSSFKKQSVRALVATDVAARGIDIDRLPHVVNFELPNNPEDYVHRIGRTGRGGNSGAAISLVSHEERGQLKAIQRLVKRDIPAEVINGFEPQKRAPSGNRPRRNPGFKGRGRPQGKAGRPNNARRQAAGK